MKAWIAIAAAAALAAGCASFDGRGLVPGQSTAAQVDALMGPAADKRMRANGETWLYYPRQPYGLETYVARIAPDGKLAAIEQRLTDENVALIQRGTTRGDQVRELLGPPYTATQFPRMSREILEYRMRVAMAPSIPHALYVQVSPDGIVREVYFASDPDYRLSDCCEP